MSVTKIEGISNFPGGKFEELELDGICTINGEIEADRISIKGIINANGDIISKGALSCDGMMTLQGSMKASEINIQGVVNMKGAKIQAEKVNCTGVISSDAEVLADEIVVEGVIRAREIYGENVGISMKTKAYLFGKDRPFAETIEATNVWLKGVKAKNVSGENVKIGAKCVIENVDCSGELTIDKKAKVKNIVENSKQ